MSTDTDTDIHSCSYYCERPACIKAQRNELRDKEPGRSLRVHTLSTLLHDWRQFAADVRAADCAGQEWLDELKARTEEGLKP